MKHGSTGATLKITQQQVEKEFNGNLKELGRILNSRELISDASRDTFEELSRQLLNHLYQGADSEKITPVLHSELITTYGLSIDSAFSEQIAMNIIEWWDEKNGF